MSANDKRGRYTLRFNPADPQQEKVIRLLDEQGRHKAAFITSAVLSYVQGDGVVPYPSASCDAAQIRQIVLDVLAQQTDSEEHSADAVKGQTVPGSQEESGIISQSAHSTITNHAAEVESDIPDEMFSAVSEALQGFRN